MHWSLTQFQGSSEVGPGTPEECLFAVMFLLLALVILASFVSSLTNNMRQLQDLQNEKTFQQHCVRTYLAENHISAELSVQVKKYIEWQRRREQRRKQDEEVLMILPTKLLMDLHDEVRGPVLNNHPFFGVFREKFPRAVRRMAHEAVFSVAPSPNEEVFVEGDACTQMYFVVNGHLRYIHKPNMVVGRVRNGHAICWEEEEYDDGGTTTEYGGHACQPVRVGRGDWVSEPVLWTEWEHCGDLTGLDDSTLLAMEAGAFATAVKAFPTAQATASFYARKFVAALDQYGQIFTDLVDHENLFASEFKDEEENSTDSRPWFEKLGF